MANVLRQRIPWGSGINASETTALMEEAAVEGIELETLATEGGVLAAFEAAEASGAALDATGIGAPIGIAIGALAAIGFGAYEIYEHFHKSGVPDHKIPSPQQISRNMRLNKEKIEEHKAYNEYKNSIEYTDTETNEEVFEVQTFEKQAQSGLTLPGSNYIGPGNPLENGPPLTFTDYLAKQHDYAYANAKHSNDVFDADAKFLEDTKTNFLFNGNPIEKAQSAIGHVGILAKNTYEKHFGVKYPSNLSGKQWHRHINSRKLFSRRILNLQMLTRNGSNQLIKLILISLKQINNLQRVNKQRKQIKELHRLIALLDELNLLK